MSARILITGGSGLLGLNWAIKIKKTHEVILGVHRRAVSLSDLKTQQLSLESVDSFVETLDRIKPDYVIHAAGLASVELCEAKPDLAHHINVKLSENVARACMLRGVQLAHISTDHLFRGDREFLDEDSAVDPINIYGKTKAEAEVRVQEACAQALVIRTNFYGWGPSYRQSFSDWVLSNLKMGHPITLFDDVFFSPIYVGVLVEIVHKLFDKFATGTFNVVGDQRVSKYQFAMQLSSTFGLDNKVVCRGSVHSQQNRVVRPRDMSLSNKKLKQELGIQVGGIKEHLSMMAESQCYELTVL